MTFKIGDKVPIKEFFTWYEGKIYAVKDWYYEVEANGHSHFLNETEISDLKNRFNKENNTQ